MKRHSFTARLVVGGLIAALIQGFQASEPSMALEPGSLQPAFEKPTPMKSVPGTPLRRSGSSKAGSLTSGLGTATTWPKPGAALLELPAGSRRGAGEQAAVAGSLPVRVATPAGEPAGEVRVDVGRRADAAQSGVSGILLGVDSTGSEEIGRVRLTVDYSAYRDVFGGDWASRVSLVAVDQAGTEVSGVRNDIQSRTLTADVELASGGSSLAVTATPEGSTGDFKATSLTSSGSWQTNLNSGNFSWSYPMRVPPVPGGLEPGVDLSYSSQSVDGRVVAQNNQPSWVGEGWNLWPGFIERSYKGCVDDLGGNNGQTKTGDLCWETDNAASVAGPIQGKLVRVGEKLWRPETDDGTRVEQVTGAANGDNDGEYWVVTTTDGTRYYFGLNRLPGWSDGKATTNSAWTAPVYGNDASEPCHAATFASSACTQAYRWNLDYVVDVHGNSMSYCYSQETNKYGQNMGRRRPRPTPGAACWTRSTTAPEPARTMGQFRRRWFSTTPTGAWLVGPARSTTPPPGPTCLGTWSARRRRARRRRRPRRSGRPSGSGRSPRRC